MVDAGTHEVTDDRARMACATVLGVLDVRSPPVETGEPEARWIGARLAGWLRHGSWSPDALYAASDDAGAAASVQFWTEARERGLRFASPRLFPWTLANSTVGQLAKDMGIRGPSHTFVGGVAATEAAIVQAIDDLVDGVVAVALVVGMHRESADEGVRVVAMVVAMEHGGVSVATMTDLGDSAAPDPQSTPFDMAELVRTIESGGSCTFGASQGAVIHLSGTEGAGFRY